ncbi:hypothetical protein AAG570_009384 [Ranatra chinensis]|uniref:Uncharacterized protein n=1 Tax=Ranatra chinensis TaxID=642074 RepID=A0ABD0YNX9_9HEMI
MFRHCDWHEFYLELDTEQETTEKEQLIIILRLNVFGWKGRSDSQCSGDGWSIFGKSNVNNANKSSVSVDKFSEDAHSIGGDSGRGIQGSTGLIQLERPAWLPAKSRQESQAHADQHDKIIHSARKREFGPEKPDFGEDLFLKKIKETLVP